MILTVVCRVKRDRLADRLSALDGANAEKMQEIWKLFGVEDAQAAVQQPRCAVQRWSRRDRRSSPCAATGWLSPLGCDC